MRAYLRERLPDYMVPSLFIMLDVLPLTSSGKVDRRALPAPEQVAPRAEPQEETAPRTSVEQMLTDIWSQVLRLPQVGIHDNFFALGGDSILSLSLIAQARRAGLQLTVKQLFQAPTIAQLSQLVTPVAPPDPIATSMGQERGSSQGALTLTPIQRWFFEQGLSNPHHWNQAFLLHLPAELSVAWLEQAVQWVLGQHDVFRLRFVPPSSEAQDWQASYVPVYEPVPFTLVDLREWPEEEQASRMSERCNQEQASLHLQNGPLARTVLFHLTGERPWRLLLLSHHLVIDTVSWRILLDELSGAYERLQQGQPLELEATSSSFQQWAQRAGGAGAAGAVGCRRSLAQGGLVYQYVPAGAGGGRAARATGRAAHDQEPAEAPAAARHRLWTAALSAPGCRDQAAFAGAGAASGQFQLPGPV